MIEIYPYASNAQAHFPGAASETRVFVNDQEVQVLKTPAGNFAAFGMEGEVEVRIEDPLLAHNDAPETILVRPLRHGLAPRPEGGGTFRFSLHQPVHLWIETIGLMLFANPLETNKPSEEDPNVLFFEAGRVHEANEIEIHSGQTLYIEGGAVVNGYVRSHGTQNVEVRGFGVLNGSGYEKGSLRLAAFDGCKDVSVRDIIMVGTPAWNLVFGACDGVEVNNLHVIGWVVSSDGIDICGSENVTVKNSFVRANDDCVAIKAIDFRNFHQEIHGYAPDRFEANWAKDVRHVRVSDCVFYNDRAGNALEIGFELRCERVSDVIFSDCDIIGAHGEGGVFTIHNGDRALVENITWENIRVEHFYDKLVDFRVLWSRYSKDQERGRIRNITLRNIQTIPDIYNCLSLFGGYDGEHRVEGVRLENFRIGETKIESLDQLNGWTRHADEPTFS